MKDFLREALSDIRTGRHLDVYSFIGLSIIVGGLSAVGVAGVNVSLAVILAGMVVLGQTQLQYSKRLDKAASPRGLAMMMRDHDYMVHFQDAERVSMLCIANFRFLAANSDSLSQYLERGGKLREVLIDADHAESLYVCTTRAVGSSTEVAHTRTQVTLTIDKLFELSQSTTEVNQLQAKETKYPTSHVITWFEFRRRPNVIFVVPTGFQQRTEARPTLSFQQDTDPIGYRYFAEYFENLWKWPKTRTIVF